MHIYSIFDDFGDVPVQILQSAGIEVEIHPLGMPRPNAERMKQILKDYDGVIVGTSQKITEDMFADIDSLRIIGTASVGTDHIQIPEVKSQLIRVINTPTANVQSVAEYTIGCALSCCKRLYEGNILYREGKDNKKISAKPEDLSGKILGVVGAGNISKKIMEYGMMLGMEVIFWTAHPENHSEINTLGIKNTSLEELVSISDVISVNLPNNDGTRNLINSNLITSMKSDAIFISISRIATLDYKALFYKAKNNRNFYVCLDVDIDPDICGLYADLPNILITPHIAGGTVNTRKRMFKEVSESIVDFVKKTEKET